jgi:hypothetical protein
MAEKRGIEKKLYYQITHEACKTLIENEELLGVSELPVAKYLEKKYERV